MVNGHIDPSPISIDKGIAIEELYSNGLVSKSYYKYNEELINEHISNNIKLPVYVKPLEEGWRIIIDSEDNELEVPF